MSSTLQGTHVSGKPGLREAKDERGHESLQANASGLFVHLGNVDSMLKEMLLQHQVFDHCVSITSSPLCICMPASCQAILVDRPEEPCYSWRNFSGA